MPDTREIVGRSFPQLQDLVDEGESLPEREAGRGAVGSAWRWGGGANSGKPAPHVHIRGRAAAQPPNSPLSAV